MKVEDLILVSVDDHLIEPINMFAGHLPLKYQGRAPKVVTGSTGAQFWEIDGRRAPGLGLNAVVGRPKEEYGWEPVAYDQVRAGCYDIDARIDDMNVNGVLGSLCFGSFPGFSGQRFQSIEDKDYALAVIRGYNDWHINDWCGKYPGRFIPLAHLPLWDPKLAAEEAARAASMGARTITFPDNPSLLNLPSLHSSSWDPLWRACVDDGLVVSTHIGSAGQPPYASDESPIPAWITSMPMSIANAAADWLFGPMWKKFPSLKIALSEGGIGWIPYFLERADFTHMQHGAWTNMDLGGRKPSEIFRQHFLTCFIDDVFGLKNRHDIGIETICWESDYPHSDSVWPKAPEYLLESVKNLSDDEINQITHLNVMREFRYDPFSILGRENCTVGALRSKAAHVSTEPVSRGGLNPLPDASRPVTSGDVRKILAA